jgi:uncharacterized protein
MRAAWPACAGFTGGSAMGRLFFLRGGDGGGNRRARRRCAVGSVSFFRRIEEREVAKHFYVRLIPPRATFAADMTAAERAHMGEHVSYFGDLFAKGKALIYGPVMDPELGFGMAVLEAESADEARTLMDSDPTVRSGLNRYTVAPMIVGASRAPSYPAK